MKKSIKMIAIDMDGTLLTSDKKVTPYTKQVLEQAIAQGIIILAATGRPLSGIPKEVSELAGVRYAVTTNGARVFDIQKNVLLFEHLLDKELALRCIGMMEKYDSSQEVYYEGKGYAAAVHLENIGHFHRNPAMWEYVLATRTAVPDLKALIMSKERGVEKVQGLFADETERQQALAEFMALGEVTPTSSLGYNIELNAAGVNKGSSLMELGRLLAIDPAEIMAIGDADNDVEMIRQAGLGIAMENALASAKAVADAITDTNDADGVAKAIEKYCLN